MMSIITDSVDAIVHHLKAGTVNWAMVIFLGLAHAAAAWGLFTLSLCDAKTLMWAFFLWPVSGLGITAGAHRLWAHRSYTATWPLRIALMLMNSMANQGSIYHWSRDHRVHHKHSDEEADPHNAGRGFFYSHVGWLLVKKQAATMEAGRQLPCDDLLEDPVVKFQRACDPWINLVMCFFVPAMVPNYFWGESFWNGFFVAGALRYCYVLHATWCVNSVAHFFGERPYDETSLPAENWFVSFVAIGEGWHNWHHRFPYDYATSEYGASAQYNPTKMFIDTCIWLGLASDPKRATKVWARMQAKKEEERLHTKKLSTPRDRESAASASSLARVNRRAAPMRKA
jgi:stearoyl-CoA desaturase (delta-9 desaturase)